MKVAHQIHPWTPNPIDFESEETEVKKDKKWLKDSVTKEIQDLFSITNLTYFDFESTNQKLRGLVDQLDEPETNSQIDKLANFIMSEVEGEPSQSQGAVDAAIRIIKSYQSQETLSQDWINKYSYAVAYDGMPDDTEIVYVDDLQNLLVPEQKELEVKIQELIERYEKEGGRHSNPENAWIREFITDLESLIEKKEKEPKYYVDLDTAAYVAKWVRDGSVQIYTDSVSGNDEYELHLTEQEIKDYDPRFWLFAVKVEEREE